MKKRSVLFSLVFTGVLAVGAQAGKIPTISGPVATEFGVYEPVAVDIQPAVADQTVAGDFSNVAFFEKSRPVFDKDALDLLARNQFVALPGRFKQIHDLYNWAADNDLAVFVTADALLHGFHILYDYALRILETDRFQYDLQALDGALVAQLEKRKSADPAILEELTRLLAFIATASKLADPKSVVPAEASELVQAELTLIEAHQGPDFSPVMGYREDYSQYVPRGHYTRSEALRNYFKAMMWYGRMGFRLRPGDTPELIARGRSETRMALNLVAVLSGLTVGGEPALDVWERIYRPTVFFVGSADDLTAAEYAALAREVYGKEAGQLTPEEIADSLSLDSFIERAADLRAPRINSSLLVDGQDAAKATKGFRFMGQRFIPDSYMMWRLVHPNVNGRYFPRGLDVMAVLGSTEAEILLVDTYKETSYPDYRQALDSLKTEFSSLPAGTWAENLYWNWLYCLAPLFDEKGQGYPSFMRRDAWRRKELGTALGSWAELRHDTILYAKQSYSFETSIPLPQEYAAGYVEPEPHVFARLAALARYMRNGLGGRNLLPEEISWRLASLESLCLNLKLIAEKELKFQSTTEAESKVISTIGETLEKLVEFPSADGAPEWQSETDEEMAVIADVHTDPNSLQALEVGVGYPLALYVIVPTAAGPVLTVGGMFSYYEFKQPLADRLTDEAWQGMLRSSTAPSPSEWLDRFLYNPAQGFSTEYSRYPAKGAAASSGEPRLELPAESVRSGDEFQVRVAADSAETLRVRFWLGDELMIETGLSPVPEARGVFSATVSTIGWPAGVVRAELVEAGTAGISAFLEIAQPARASADLDGNGRKDILDLIELIRRVVQGSGADLNGDSKTDIFDLIQMLRILSGDAESYSAAQARLTALGGCGTGDTRSLTEPAALKLEIQGDKVLFTHSGAGYNCCLDSINVRLEVVGEGLLRVIEKENTANPCRCVCNYTVYGEITGLTPGDWRIEVVEELNPKNVLCAAEINIP
jgi:hypothetical protein